MKISAAALLQICGCFMSLILTLGKDLQDSVSSVTNRRHGPSTSGKLHLMKYWHCFWWNACTWGEINTLVTLSVMRTAAYIV